MKKRLLMVTFALLTVATSFAFQPGEYAYNSTQRFKITGDNLVTNGNFANSRDGWYGADKETSPNAEVWDLVTGAGPNGENVLQSLAATADQPLANSWQLAEGSYIVSIDVKAPAAGNTTIGAGQNSIDFFINTTGSLTKEASTEEAPVKNVSSKVFVPAEEWKTLVWFFSIEQGQSLVMRIEKLAADYQITNISIHQATEVYDTRIAERRIAFTRLLMEDSNFNTAEAQDAKAALTEYIAIIEGMMASGEMDDADNAEALLSGLEGEGIEPFLAITSKKVNSFLTGTETSTLTGTGKINRGDNNSLTSKFPSLDLTGGNWQHASNADYLYTAIQGSYSNSGAYTVFHNDFPAGKYFITGEIRNAYVGSSSDYEFTWTLENMCKIFIGKDSLEIGPIAGEDYQRFYYIANIEEGEDFRAGFYWPGYEKGSAFFVKDVEVRSFNQDIEAGVQHKAAFKAYMTQWNAAVTGRNNLYNTIGNPNYPWGQTELIAAREKYDPYYHAQNAKGWSTAAGADAGIASTDELTDWALYQGFEEYSEPTEEGAEPTRLEYQLVRGYQNAVNAAKATNKPLTDLADAIDAAKRTRNENSNLTGDRETYKTAILAALASLNDIRTTTTDAIYQADSTRAVQAQEALATATEAFLKSSEIAPIIDIDFSNNFELQEDGTYIIKGTAGQMNFPVNVDLEHGETNNGADWALGYGEEALDVLHVGDADAYTTFEAPTDEEALKVSFDLWFGGLNKSHVWVNLLNANNDIVAGFKYQCYSGSYEYNDFYDSETKKGMPISGYTNGTGKDANVAILANKYKNTFELEINYKEGTVKGTQITGAKGTCNGEAIPMKTLADNKIVKFSIGCNYSKQKAPARRCWFDNLKISKYSLASGEIEEDITENPWIEYVVDGIKSVANDASNAAAIYTISGMKVNKITKPGLYIQNGKKFVIK